MVIRRDGDRWTGEYFHPRVRPGNHEFETHRMVFDRKVANPTEITPTQATSLTSPD